MSAPDAQVQWLINGFLVVVSTLISIILWLSKSHVSIYRGKVDALEQSHTELIAICVTREDFRDELDRRFDEMGVRHLQMHNHNAETNNRQAETLNRLAAAIDGLRSDLREDMRGVHERVDHLRERRRGDAL
jgi:vacuolar-type H+-ATPase subunit I/STV1